MVTDIRDQNYISDLIGGKLWSAEANAEHNLIFGKKNIGLPDRTHWVDRIVAPYRFRNGKIGEPIFGKRVNGVATATPDEWGFGARWFLGTAREANDNDGDGYQD